MRRVDLNAHGHSVAQCGSVISVWHSVVQWLSSVAHPLRHNAQQFLCEYQITSSQQWGSHYFCNLSTAKLRVNYDPFKLWWWEAEEVARTTGKRRMRMRWWISMVGLETRRYGGLEDTMGDGARSLGNGAAAGRGVALLTLLLLLPLSPTPVTENSRS